MSWNITGVGTKQALLKEVNDYFHAMVKSVKGTPNEKEYVQAGSALTSLLHSVPDTEHVLKIESWGSAGYGEYPYFNVHINIDAMVPTIK